MTNKQHKQKRQQAESLQAEQASPSLALARQIARRFFAKRGNNYEVHLREQDLVILLGVAIERGKELVNGGN